MRHRGTAAAVGRRAHAGQEGSLISARFVGSFPTADFPLRPLLPEIAVIGRSNVGKSSLVNALVGRKALARTSRTPGKTQMCTVFAVDETYYLVDLPGYGFARVSHGARTGFRRLIREYLSTRRSLVGAVWLLDIRHAPSRDDHAMSELLADRGLPVVVTVTKADKIPRGRRATQVRTICEALEIGGNRCVITSVQTREGIPALRDAVASLARAPAGPAA
jgi:GTP-binding protein